MLGSSYGGTCNVTVNQTDGLVSATGTNGVMFAVAVDVTATYNLDGGVLLTSAVTNPGGAPAANQTFTFGGGTLRASADNSDFMSATGIGNVLVKDGGAIIDTNDGATDHAITISNNLVPAPGSTGGLTKQGGGTLTLGGANTYAGPTAITGGTLKLAAPSIPQVKLHLDATDADTIVQDSGKIINWIDKSGAGNDAVPLGGSTGADYIASGGINGNASVQFNNGVKTDRLTSAFDLNQKDITLAIVYQKLSPGSGNQALFGHDEDGGWHRLQLLNYDADPSISQAYGVNDNFVIIH
jgi:autotransporter-associated beta strand protein